jgi:branched-chain amino acid transport system substrate-binding protein
LRAIHEIGLDTNMFGGALVGVATAAMRQQLGPLMNGVVVTELWEPAPTMNFPGIWEFLKQYQAKAPAEGVDPLGYFLPPFAYAEMQILEQAITATGSLDDDKLAQYMHSHSFDTIVGEITFGPDGEWTEARNIFVQYHDIKSNDLEQFRNDSRITVLAPEQYKTGDLIWPYTKARGA